MNKIEPVGKEIHKNKFFKRVSLFILSVIAFTLVFTIGVYSGRKGFDIKTGKFPKVVIERKTPDEFKDVNFNLFWRVWDTLDKQYFAKDKLVPAKMVYGAIKGMVAAVGDPYTVFLSPDENKVVEEDLSGNFDGIGIQIGFKGSQLAVMSAIPNTPAEKAGIESGDFIIGIKDEDKKIETGTVGMNLDEAVKLIRGKAGTKVTLTLLRKDSEKPITIDVVRDTIDVPSVTLDFVGNDKNIAHLKVVKFAAETQEEWNKYVTEILKQKDLKGVVVDVRDNPGGYMQGAIDLASEFLENGQTVVVEDNGNGKKEEFKAGRLGKLRDEKLVVLINGGSASASEIFAGALRDNNRAKLVGEVSFGKGTIQEPQQLENGAGLHITIARWLTPKGDWVNEGGLKPDIEVKDDSQKEGDEQLQEAIKLFE